MKEEYLMLPSRKQLDFIAEMCLALGRTHPICTTEEDAINWIIEYMDDYLDCVKDEIENMGMEDDD